MYGRVVLSFVSVFLLLFSYTILIGFLDIRSYFNPPSKFPVVSPGPCAPERPLRVYMYDLPRRFNVGMLNRRSAKETPVTVRDWPPWPKNSGLKRQHSVEYWMMGALLYEGEEDYREAIRVSDPEMADVFFVPFFSSLSFNTHGRNMTDPATEIDRRLQVLHRSNFSHVLLSLFLTHYSFLSVILLFFFFWVYNACSLTH